LVQFGDQVVLLGLIRAGTSRKAAAAGAVDKILFHSTLRCESVARTAQRTVRHPNAASSVLGDSAPRENTTQSFEHSSGLTSAVSKAVCIRVNPWFKESARFGPSWFAVSGHP
jgi:hypothetical protein